MIWTARHQVMNRWLLSKLGASRLAHLGLTLVIVGLVAEALLIAAAMVGPFLSDHADKFWTALFTIVIAIGVWFEYLGHKEASRPRQLTDEQKEALRPVLNSDFFQKDPKPALRVASVSDAEAQMYAMQFMRLFESCKVNIYPTNGGLPLNVVQHVPSADGLQLMVKSMNNPHPAFAHFQRLVHSLGIAIPVGEDPAYRDNEATLEILKKPD